MADERVNFVLSAQDRASTTVRRLKGELGTMGGAAGTAAGPLGRLSAVTGGMISPMTLGIGAAIGLGTAFLGAAQAAMDEQRGIVLLTTAIRENDPANVSNIASIEATIRERQNLAFADDEQRESLGALVAVTRDSDVALRLQRTAMDLARLKGMDLATASTLIGKVYSGNIGILSRYGIQLAEGTTATEAIAEIQRRAAGQAEAYGNTTAGAMESMGLAFDDVVEDIGAALLPALTSLAIFARDDLIPALRAVGDVLGPIIEIAGDVASALGPAGLAGAFGGMVDEADAKLASLKAAAEMHMPAAIAAMQDALVRGGPVIAAEAGRIAGMLPSEISRRVADIRAAGRNNVVQFAAGMLDAQNDPMVAIEAMQEAMRTALSRGEEIARLQGQLASKALGRGLTSEIAEVRLAAQAARSVITDRLEFLNVDTYNYGYNAGAGLATGLNSQYGVVRNAAGNLAAAVRGQIAIRSEPTDFDSPLRGITKWGGNISATMAAGIKSKLALARGAAGALGGALVPSFGGAMATAGGGGIGLLGSAAPLQIQVVMPDGRVLAEVVTKEQYYRSPAGPSVLPRGS